MKIHPFLSSSISEKEWDTFVESSNNGTIFHTRRFLSYHPQGRFHDSSLVIEKNDKLFAVFPAVIIERNGKRILSSHSGASYGGFVHTDDLNFKDAHDCVKLLKETAVSLECDAIQIT
ncbi:MAG: GNAT family N-acetyltransferase, partial [Candidatus Kapabacteria bacterium]|nr:GNAT family N-acetyltransferase [Candidatus Kapabacteria bacterium]